SSGVTKCSGDQLRHLDVAVDEREPRRGILDLLSKLRPEWKTQHIQMKKFTEGITNQLIGCYVGSLQEPGCVLVRLYGRMTELYVNRDREVEMFQVFNAHGCGPEIYCSFQNGICYEFVRGNVLEDELLRQPSIYRLIAAEMGKIHSIQPKRGQTTEPQLWAKMSHFLTLVKSSITRNPSLILSNHFFDKNQSQLLSLRSTLFLHHILAYSDLLTGFQSTVVGGKFFPLFSVLRFFILLSQNWSNSVTDVDYSLYPSQELQRDWLTAYLESYKRSTGLNVTVTDEEVTKLYVEVCKFSLASNFFWGLWAILQSRFSSIDFDFQRYAIARLSYYFEKKEEYFELTLSQLTN
uniref:ethanolamine kinase n=1 Tax=Xiphophorus couchianus TaxID=32473 RepID=A0A3B5KRP5_9TELE